MFATADARRTAAVVALCLLCCCYAAQEDVQETVSKSRHDHVRTRSTTRQNRAQKVTADFPEDSSVENTNSDNVLHNYLIQGPSNIIRNLMKYGVHVVQYGMDAFEGVSSTVFRAARGKTGGPRSSTRQTTLANDPNEKHSRVGRLSTKHDRSVEDDQKQQKPGLIRSAINMIDSGIAGVEQITDLSLLLGNMGTHKILAKLNGQNGNKEVMNLLMKYLASRVEMMTADGNGPGLIDDVGTITTFIAKNDDVTNSISIIMEKFMNNRDVRIAMMRMAINLLHSNPSTSCLLDKLPLKPSDVRMMFDVFVGKNGQMMLKTIAGLLSELTTGPDTKAFLESALGMASMFKTDNSDAGSESEKPNSIMGSFTNFFMGGDLEDESDDVPLPQSPMVKKKKEKTNNDNVPLSKPAKKKPIKREEDSWFSNDAISLGNKNSKSVEKDDSQENKSKLNPKNTRKAARNNLDAS